MVIYHQSQAPLVDNVKYSNLSSGWLCSWSLRRQLSFFLKYHLKSMMHSVARVGIFRAVVNLVIPVLTYTSP